MDKIPVNPIIKPSGRNCNAACAYCFYRTEAGSDVQMSLATLRRVTSEVARVAQRPTFSWQGGEPTLMGIDFFEQAVALQREFLGRAVPNAFQTNGLLIDGTWASFLKKNEFLVGVSLDGPKDIHDAVRRRAGNQGTFDQAVRACELLANHDAAFNILCVVGKHNVGESRRLWRFYRSKGFNFLQFIPCLQHNEEGEVLLPQSPMPEELGTFYCEIFDEWIAEARADRIASVRLFDNVLNVLLGQPPTTCMYSPSCVNQIVIDADGSVYACDWYVLPEWRLGNIMETELDAMLESDLNKTFQENSRKRSERCQACKFVGACHGGCPLHRTIRDDGENYFCPSYLALFEHGMDGFLEVARTIYETQQRRQARRAPHTRARPNDPCPCGSGRRFRKCCGRRTQ